MSEQPLQVYSLAPYMVPYAPITVHLNTEPRGLTPENHQVYVPTTTKRLQKVLLAYLLESMYNKVYDSKNVFH